jgi:hypothetical protein
MVICLYRIDQKTAGVVRRKILSSANHICHKNDHLALYPPNGTGFASHNCFSTNLEPTLQSRQFPFLSRDLCSCLLDVFAEPSVCRASL